MLGTIEKVFTIVGAPVAVLYSLGFLAFVNDLWYVEYEYGFRFLAAWHAAGLIDKEVILGVGTWYLLFSLLISFALLQLFALLFNEPRKCTFLPPNTKKQQPSVAIEQKPPTEKWLWHVLVAIPVGIVLVFAWTYFFTDGLVNNMPCVEIVRTVGAEDSQGGSASTGTEELIKGMLLSNDSAYWYVLDNSKGRVTAIPLAEASEVEVLPRWPARFSCP
jgi:hypothetical protein